MSEIANLRLKAVGQTLFSQTTQKKAIQKLGFVQADPIRSPARAQDLVLRHRVKGYKVGDLEKYYTSLDIEEDFLYAHGFVRRDIWQLLHPREISRLTEFDKKVLGKVRELGKIHPKDLSAHFKEKREINWWGGHSNATKMSLDRLHYYGYLRIAGRKNGIRLYEPLYPDKNPLPISKRLEQIILAVVNILSPVTEKTLHASLHRIRRQFGHTKPTIIKMLKEGSLLAQKVDGITYIFKNGTHHESRIGAKFLAPFDPIVWDRPRFEHLWGWQYRFEAYTPKEKRIRGYYAMPLLWKDSVIGWANVDRDGKAEIGYVKGEPKDKNFKEELEKEIEAMKAFLTST